MKTKRILLLAILFSSFAVGPSDLPGCGPAFPQAVFTLTRHPQSPLSEFAQGQLGVIQPSYYRKYLVAAYRYLSNQPLSAEEQEAFLNPQHTGLSYWGFSRSYKIPGLKQWLETRNRIPGVDAPREIEIFR